MSIRLVLGGKVGLRNPNVESLKAVLCLGKMSPKIAYQNNIVPQATTSFIIEQYLTTILHSESTAQKTLCSCAVGL